MLGGVSVPTSHRNTDLGLGEPQQIVITDKDCCQFGFLAVSHPLPERAAAVVTRYRNPNVNRALPPWTLTYCLPFTM